MLVHVEIALCLQLQVKAAMMREQFQHVIKEADAGRHVVSPPPLDGERDLNLRFFADAIDASLSHRLDAPGAMPSSSQVSCKAASKRSACARGPNVIRTQPSHP